jgi:hypothetical protein
LWVAADEEAAACSDGGAVTGFEFYAEACGVEALVVALVGELA